MDFYEIIDNMYKNGEGDKVEAFLEQALRDAIEEDNADKVVIVLNELVGYYRENEQHDKSIAFAEELYKIVSDSDISDSVAYGTTLLNIANAYRAAGLNKESLRLHNEAKEVYDKNLPRDAYEYASLYNNLSLLFINMGDDESAEDCLKRALAIVSADETRYVETASTYVNLASIYSNRNDSSSAIMLLEKAMELYEKDEQPDFHYTAALTSLGEIYFKLENYEKALVYYEKALAEIERISGRNESYQIMQKNINIVKQKLQTVEKSDEDSISGLKLSEEFYLEYGAKMIHERYPRYEKSIAVGLVGEGSECFGYDDALSRDHDFGPGFCLWLPESVYRKIGKKLQESYDMLPKTYKGITRFDSDKGSKRVGVFSIGDFYKSLTNFEQEPKSVAEWLFVSEGALAAATNGKIFKDDLGEFTRIRETLLNYYPDFIWGKRLIGEMQHISKYGQYNYERCLKRGDVVTAAYCISEFCDHVMSMCFLLERRYAPYYKWKYHAMKELEHFGKLCPLVEKLILKKAFDEEIPEIIEQIVGEIIERMKEMKLTALDDRFLENHEKEVITNVMVAQMQDDEIKLGRDYQTPLTIIGDKDTKTNDDTKANDDAKVNDAYVDEIVELEWKAFDKVKNEGGRAFCQDDYSTFSIMRRSQYDTWPLELLISYTNDFKAANDMGWNLISEKYARMMKSTCPEKYANLEHRLPKISDEQNKMIEAIVSVQVNWMSEFAKEYPKAAGNARSISTQEDTEWNTSYETYLRGEISTYSPDTLWLYGKFVAELANEKKNLAYMIMENTAHYYGYKDLDELERKLP